MSKSWDNATKYDFQVRVHIIEVRELQPRDSNGMSDPVVFVRALNKKNNTVTQHNTTICTFDHLMFFEYKLVPQEFFAGKVNVTVYDANTIMRNVEIGSYEFGIQDIYKMPGQELYRKWVGLIDSSGKFPGVQGYLKLSITVLGPGEKAPSHTAEEEEDEEQEGADLQSLVLLPPSIQTEIHRLSLSFFRAEGLPKMDKFGKCDGYVSVKFGSNPELKTEVIKNTYAPAWNEQLTLPITTPLMSDIIPVTVKDWDMESADEIVATFFLKFSDIASYMSNNMMPSANNNNNNNAEKIDWSSPRWVNLYGLPDGETSTGITEKASIAKKIEKGFIEGSAWRGRVLMSAFATKDPNCKLGKAPASPPRDPQVMNYVLRLDLFEAAEVDTKKDISVELTIGAASVDCKKVSTKVSWDQFYEVMVKNGNGIFYRSLDDLAVVLPADRSQMPDVFINIWKHPALGSKKRLGYIRIKASTIGVNDPIRWELIEGDVLTKLKTTSISGFLQYRLIMGPADKMPAREAVKMPKFQKYQLRAHIYQGKDLPSGDADAASDPFLTVGLSRWSQKTKIIKGTCFPLWYETILLDVELPENMATAPDVHVLVWDWDTVGSDDFLGRFSVPVSQLTEKFRDVPIWYKLYRKDPNITDGEILASFQLIPAAHLDKYGKPPPITPKFRDCTLEISAIGLRQMIPYQLLPMQQPFVTFDCGGPENEKVTTKLSSKPSPQNPNHLEVLKLPVKVPENKLFSIPINIRVYDDRLIKTLVGTRSISVTQFIPWDDTAQSELQIEDQPQRVSGIPGAALIKQEPANENNNNELKVDVQPEDDPSLGLLAEKQPELKQMQDAMIKNISQGRTLPDVQESTLPGFDSELEETKTKREEMKDELELNMEAPTFCIYTLYRAKKKKGISVKYEVGKFKGRFRLIEKGMEDKVDPPLDLLSLYAPATYIVRVYALEGFQLVPRDMDGRNNPYIRIHLGKQKIKDVNEAKQDTSRPQFFKCFELKANFPEDTLLDVGVWDYNKILSDELIGSTKIDLENRLYSKSWRDMKFKPIEFRTLWTASSSNPQGQLKMWVDILTLDEAKSNPPEVIAPPAPIQYELRVIIWETKEVVFKDKKMSDIFVVGFPETQKPQVTDTHWRSEDGNGSFNWRMKFPITVPCKIPRFKIQIWDKDVLSPNDAIGECNLNLRPFYMKAWRTKSRREVMEKQWLNLLHPAAAGIQGKVLVDFELLTIEEANSKPAGFGREEPNQHPELPKPNRPETSFNPFLRPDKYLQKVFWKNNKWKFYGCCIACVIVIVLIIIIYLAILFQ